MDATPTDAILKDERWICHFQGKWECENGIVC